MFKPIKRILAETRFIVRRLTFFDVARRHVG